MTERFEHTDLSSGLVARVGAYLAGSVAVIFLLVYLFLHLLGGKLSTRQVTGPTAATPAWGEPVPADYRWVNREQKIISIPIDRAIELTVARGLPARPQP